MKIKDSNIFVIEPDEKQRLFLRTQLMDQGASVRDFTQFEQLLAALEKKVCDLVVLSLNSEELDEGHKLIQLLKKNNPEMPIVVLSELKSDLSILRALKSGASGYLIKPFTTWDLVKSIRNNLYSKRERSKKLQLRKPLKAVSEISAEILQVSSEQAVIRAPLSFKCEGAVVKVENKLFARNVRKVFVGQVEHESGSGVEGLFKTYLNLEGLSDTEREEMKKVFLPWR